MAEVRAHRFLTDPGGWIVVRERVFDVTAFARTHPGFFNAGQVSTAIAVARALVQLAGPAGRDDVQEVLDAPFTAPPVRAPLSQVVQAAEAAEGAEAEGAEAEDAAAESGSEG